MDLSEYQKKARSTAIYPNIGNNFAYVALGMADEAGELLEKAYDQNTKRSELSKELGDVCWYASQACSEIGASLADITPSKPELATDIGSLVVAASKIAGKAKKAIRDDEGVITEEKAKDIEALVGQVLGCVSSYAESLGTTLDKVLEQNIEKLFSRKERGVLKGSGDNR